MMTPLAYLLEPHTHYNMANTFNKQNKVVFDVSQLKALEVAFKRAGTSLQSGRDAKELDKELRKAVKPWQDSVNKGWMYNFVKKDKGRLQDPFGNTKIRGKRKGVYGRRVGPKTRGKSGGWFSHFFASPARQLDRKYKIPFYSRFRSKNAEVGAAAFIGIDRVVRKMTNRIFR